MERRVFLRGLLGSVTGAAAVVQLATPADAAALVAQSPVILGQPRRLNPGGPFRDLGDEVYMRDGRGRFVVVGYLQEIIMRHQAIDVTSFYDGQVRLDPGFLHGELRFIGPP